MHLCGKFLCIGNVVLESFFASLTRVAMSGGAMLVKYVPGVLACVVVPLVELAH